MKVVIDISSYFYSQRGVTRYISCLLEALNSLKTNDFEIKEIGYRIPNFGYEQPARAIKTIGREFVWQPLVAPLQIRQGGYELLHATCNPCVQAPRNIPKVVTLHDLEMFHTPDRFRWWTRQRFPFEAAAYRKANRLICVSQSTADDAIKFLEFPADRIDVIHLGSRFNTLSPEEKISRPLPSEYFLFVSALEPGKNLKLLNQAYRLAENAGIALPPLLIVGERVAGVSHEGEPPTSWQYLGRCSDEELAFLYRRTLALLAPTRYEGFGLPILEAMSLGAAVICSRVSSLPEVGGDVALYAEQTPAAYLAEMMRIIQVPHLREDRIEAGLLRAKDFSWQRCAQETIEVYRTTIAHA